MNRNKEFLCREKQLVQTDRIIKFVKVKITKSCKNCKSNSQADEIMAPGASFASLIVTLGDVIITPLTSDVTHTLWIRRMMLVVMVSAGLRDGACTGGVVLFFFISVHQRNRCCH